MTQCEAHELLYEFLKKHFVDETVIFAKQSRAAKPPLPLVVINPGKSDRQRTPNYEITGSVYSAEYQICEDVEINLFTKGKPVYDENERVVAFWNSATEEMLAFIDFVNKANSDNWCRERLISLEITGEISDATGVLNESSYEYKAKIDAKYRYQETAVGHRYESGTVI